MRADGWAVSGDWGGEVESIGESFGGATLFEPRLDPTDTPEDLAEEFRFRDQSTSANALARLRVGYSAPRYLDFHSTVRVAPHRFRGDAEFETGLRHPAVDLWMGDRVHAQGGSDDPGGGVLNVVRLGARWKSLPEPFSLRATVDHEQSRAGADSLAGLFDYYTVRPRLELRYDLGWRGELEIGGGVVAKRAEHGRGSYDRPWLELNGRYAFAAGPTVDVNLLTESRRYLRVDSLRSTIHQDELRARTVLPVSERSRTEWSLHLANVQYATSSSVFQDHVSGDVEAIFAVAIDRQGPRSASEPAPNGTWKEEQDADSLLFALELDELLEPGAEMDLAELLRPRLSLGLGFHGEILRNERAGDADYDVVAAVVSLAREASAGLWFDFRTEVGRRDYRGSGASGGLIFEGLDLSLAGSDFRFVSATVLVEVPLPLSCKVSGFGQLDREWHDVDADDFTLWLTTLAVTRSF